MKKTERKGLQKGIDFSEKEQLESEDLENMSQGNTKIPDFETESPADDLCEAEQTYPSIEDLDNGDQEIAVSISTPSKRKNEILNCDMCDYETPNAPNSH